jgi:very-short-patch-repair endonuclease
VFNANGTSSDRMLRRHDVDFALERSKTILVLVGAGFRQILTPESSRTALMRDQSESFGLFSVTRLTTERVIHRLAKGPSLP